MNRRLRRLRRVLVASAAVLLLIPVVATSPAGAQAETVAEDVFAFGDADFHGSTGTRNLNRPIVGMAPTPTDGGYWLVASDGGIFSFGDAGFFGSTGSRRLNQPVVGMAATPTGNGYWLVAADGGMFTFGDAPFRGSAVAPDRYRRFVGMAATTTGGGYWLTSSGACVFGGGTGPVSSLPESHVLQQTDLRAGAHECFERVVFEFQVERGSPDGAVSYQVGYADPPFSGPSAMPIPVEGGAFLDVLFRGARSYDPDTLEPTYAGPSEVHPGLPAVREVQRIEDFEATLAWVVGLDRRRAFNVFELDAPDRLVIDIGPPTDPPPATTTVQNFFTPTGSANCGAVQAAPRLVPAATPLTHALREQLEGVDTIAAARGLQSPFSLTTTGGMLNGVAIRNRTAHVDFGDFSDQLPNASTSCGSTQLLAQLDATVTQFPTVDRAVYSFDGDVDAFYNWLQRSRP